jgi:hypothetical protein
VGERNIHNMNNTGVKIMDTIRSEKNGKRRKIQHNHNKMYSVQKNCKIKGKQGMKMCKTTTIDRNAHFDNHTNVK